MPPHPPPMPTPSLFSSLPEDAVKCIWLMSDLRNAHASLVLDENSPFRNFASKIITNVRVLGATNAVLDYNTIKVMVYDVDLARQALRRVRDTITHITVSAPESPYDTRTRLTMTPEYARMLACECPYACSLYVDFKYRPDPLFYKAVDVLFHRLGRSVMSLKVASNGAVPQNLVRLICNKLRALRRLTIAGSADFGDLSQIWRRLGGSLEAIDLSEYGASFARHTPHIPDLFPSLIEHCPNLRSVHFRPGVSADWHQEDVTRLCEKLGHRLQTISLMNMESMQCARIASACPNLAVVDLVETHEQGECMRKFGNRVQKLMLIPKMETKAEAYAECASHCTAVSQLTCRFDVENEDVETRVLEQPWREVERFLLVLLRCPLRASSGAMLGASFGNLRQIYIVCQRIESPTTLDSLAEANHELEFVDISMEFGDLKTYPDVQDDSEHQELAIGIANSFSRSRKLLILSVYERMVPEHSNRRALPLEEGPLRDAYLRLHRRGVAVHVYGGIPTEYIPKPTLRPM